MGGGGRGERQGRIGVGGGLTRATILGDRRRTTTKRGSFCTPRRSIRLPSNCWHRAPYPSSLAPHLPPVSETTSFIAHLCWRTFVLQRPFFNHIRERGFSGGPPSGGLGGSVGERVRVRGLVYAWVWLSGSAMKRGNGRVRLRVRVKARVYVRLYVSVRISARAGDTWHAGRVQQECLASAG